MSDAGRRALVAEFERALLEFGTFVRDLPRDLYDTPVPGDEGSVRKILGHVVGAGYVHVAYVAEHCGGVVAERRFSDPNHLDDSETFIAALLDVARFAHESLANVTDEALNAHRFVTRWGQDYDGEQMMEHATCHPGRHIRQINRFLDGELTSP